VGSPLPIPPSGLGCQSRTSLPLTRAVSTREKRPEIRDRRVGTIDIKCANIDLEPHSRNPRRLPHPGFQPSPRRYSPLLWSWRVTLSLSGPWWDVRPIGRGNRPFSIQDAPPSRLRALRLRALALTRRPFPSNDVSRGLAGRCPLVQFHAVHRAGGRSPSSPGRPARTGSSSRSSRWVGGIPGPRPPRRPPQRLHPAGTPPPPSGCRPGPDGGRGPRAAERPRGRQPACRDPRPAPPGVATVRGAEVWGARPA